MTRRKHGTHSSRMIYVCSTYSTYGVHRCSQHKAFEEDLIAVVLEDIRSLAREAKLNREALIERIAAMTPEESSECSPEAYVGMMKRMKELNRMLDRLYEEHFLGKLNDSNYSRMMGKYQREQEMIQKQIEAHEASMEEEKDKRTQAEQVAELFVKYGDITELTAGLLNALIDKITVSEPFIQEGRFVQDITIYYRHIGALEPVRHDATRFYKSEKCVQASRRRETRRGEQRMDQIRAET